MSLSTPAAFVRKWSKVALTERSACQQHFLDLCELVGHPKPADIDPTGQEFCFERGVEKSAGGTGWADVWKKGFFAFEYKGRHKDLAKAYQQLAQYRESLDNPPLLVVCDLDRIEVHTNFTGTAKRIHAISLENFGDPASLETLRNVFFHPEKLRPGVTSEAITAAAASKMAQIAVRLRERLASKGAAAASVGAKDSQEEAVGRIADLGRQLSQSFDAHAVARFLDRIVFCLFAEDIELLPDHLFTKILKNSRGQPDRFMSKIGKLFEAMATGGDFGEVTVPHFNGNLFDNILVLPLNEEEIELLYQAALMEWGAIDPSILGTLFERGLDPNNRAKLGAHYTSRTDIETLVDPVVMAPLRREWDGIKAQVDELLTKGGKPGRQKADSLAHSFLDRLGKLRFLDPACGSGNFLFVTLQRVKDLEKAVNVHLATAGLDCYLPVVGPWQFFGIETNPYAAELAQMTLWIGYLQWTRANGFGIPDSPVLRKLDNITCGDAILRFDKDGKPCEPEWPEADFIVGNPPFLGDKLMRGQLGDPYVEALRSVYAGRIPGQSDLCCYWFEKARAHIEIGRTKRAGLLATQGIRGGANREVLEGISLTGSIFFAISNRAWTLNGASVRISMVGFDGKEDTARSLDGVAVATINADLTAGADTTKARRLPGNRGKSFLGVKKNGAFDVSHETAVAMLGSTNPHGQPNSDVLRPMSSGGDIVRRDSRRWLIDFGTNTPLAEAALYAAPFGHLASFVKPGRVEAGREDSWWILGSAAASFRAACTGLHSYIATASIAKHRIFIRLDAVRLPEGQAMVFPFQDNRLLGLLHSRFHEVWALHNGTRLEDRPIYNLTTCFDTFPFPDRPVACPDTISAAADELVVLRDRWLNPPEWAEVRTLEFPGTVGGPWSRYIDASVVDAKTGIGTVRYPQTWPKDAACEAKLKKRTLTALYNERPAWLDNVHKKLDAAVAAAYGWPADLTDAQILERLLALNIEEAAKDRAPRIKTSSNP